MPGLPPAGVFRRDDPPGSTNPPSSPCRGLGRPRLPSTWEAPSCPKRGRKEKTVEQFA
jgi:hypothetical protein